MVILHRILTSALATSLSLAALMKQASMLCDSLCRGPHGSTVSNVRVSIPTNHKELNLNNCVILEAHLSPAEPPG